MIDLNLQTPDIDHIKPLASGGKDDLTNFGLTHDSCNRSKQVSDLQVARVLAWFEKLRDKVFKIWNSSETNFHKMVEGCPDFHRKQDEKIAKKYVFESIRHSYYWFHWNGDPMSVIPEINKRWRVLKFLGGLNKHTYEKNTPKDGVVDRFQVARYLPGIGKSENQRS